MVNLSGHRFGDETTGYSEYAAQLAAQEGSEGWLVLDQRIHDDSLLFTDFRQTVESNALVWADSLEALAEAIAVDPRALVEEAQALAQVAVGAAADRFGRPQRRRLTATPLLRAHGEVHGAVVTLSDTQATADRVDSQD